MLIFLYTMCIIVSKLRKYQNLSQEQLAYKLGLNRTHIGIIERAEKYSMAFYSGRW